MFSTIHRAAAAIGSFWVPFLVRRGIAKNNRRDEDTEQPTKKETSRPNAGSTETSIKLIQKEKERAPPGKRCYQKIQQHMKHEFQMMQSLGWNLVSSLSDARLFVSYQGNSLPLLG